jgi:hypothetical protein
MHHRVPANKAHHLYQSVTLVGGQVERFQSAVSALRRIYNYFEQGFPAGEVRPLERRTVGPMLAFGARTRYLTPTNGNIWPLVTDHMTTSIDPDGVLRGILNTGKCVFSEDNLVTYSEAIPSIEG